MISSEKEGLFSGLDEFPPDPVFSMLNRFNNDPASKKLSLLIGVYRDENGNPYELPVVKKVINQILAYKDVNHEYLPILGYKNFSELSSELILGKELYDSCKSRLVSIQTLSGTGGVSLFSEMIGRYLPDRCIYIPQPTWDNHRSIFEHFKIPVRYYRYWNYETLGLDFDGLIEDLSQAEDRSIILLHACAHNPTGIDPNQEQWCKIASLMAKKDLYPFFDCAYQGFASGDPEKDVFSIRHFAKAGFELSVAQSYSKNFGLYAQRLGCLTIINNNENVTNNLKSTLSHLARVRYSNPPKLGALIISKILSDPELRNEWIKSLSLMSSRIFGLRRALYDALIKRGTPGKWDHLVEQIGMFSYTGLKTDQIDRLRSEFHIYMLDNGRASLPGIKLSDVDYLADSIHKVITNS